MSVIVWTNHPNPYQREFFTGLRNCGVNLRTSYYERVPVSRTLLGWEGEPRLDEGERYVLSPGEVRDELAATRGWIHVVCGFRHPVLRMVARRAIADGGDLAYWSEPVFPGFRRILLQPFRGWLARGINRRALGVLGVGSQALNEFVGWGVDPDKVAYLPYSTPRIPEGVRCNEGCGRRPGCVRFVYAGSLERRKGVDVLIEAAAKLREQGMDFRLVMYGTGPARGKCEALVVERGLAGQVSFGGAVPPEAAVAAIADGDVFVLPSRHDGWGVVLNEAAACGRALIATEACGGSWHLIEEGGNGYRVRAGDAGALAAAMAVYGADPELAEQHGAKSLLLAGEVTAERNARRLIEALQRWCERSRER